MIALKVYWFVSVHHLHQIRRKVDFSCTTFSDEGDYILIDHIFISIRMYYYV
uniref:Uncharacterized protein n=1 Tax=Solanum lycopersicum TaxID=4081 RepID=K4BHG1_SOLLC